MKTIRKILAIIILLIAASGISGVTSLAAPPASVSFQVFYDGLAPHGYWVSYPGYGYAWVPLVGVGFRPYYTGGHWVFTDDGWMWVSDFDWGWAPFHYGSWIEDPGYGWMWIPGYNWAPAWVTWGSYNGYYGWAPIGPRFSFSVYAHPPMEQWVFLHPRYMGVSNWNGHQVVAVNHQIYIGNHYVKKVDEITVIKNQNNFNGRSFYSGPHREEIEKVAHTSFKPVAVREIDKPGQPGNNGKELNVYRPTVSNEKSTAPKPANVTPIEKLKTEKPVAPKVRETAPPVNNGKTGTENSAPQQKQPAPQPPAQKDQQVPQPQGNPNHDKNPEQPKQPVHPPPAHKQSHPPTHPPEKKPADPHKPK